MDLRPGVEIRDVFPDSYSIRELDTRRSTTLKYKEEYCYVYDNMLIAGMTPQEFINNEVSGQQKRATAEAAEEEAENGEGIEPLPANFYMGLVMPRSGPKGNYTFDLCHTGKGECVPGGWAGVFCPGCQYHGTQVNFFLLLFLFLVLSRWTPPPVGSMRCILPVWWRS